MISKKYIEQGIKYAAQKIKNRSAGSKAEKECQEHFAEELTEYADTVETQTFKVRPKAFLGWITIAGICSIAAVIFFWLYGVTGRAMFPFWGMMACVFALLCYVFEFFSISQVH